MNGGGHAWYPSLGVIWVDWLRWVLTLPLRILNLGAEPCEPRLTLLLRRNPDSHLLDSPFSSPPSPPSHPFTPLPPPLSPVQLAQSGFTTPLPPSTHSLLSRMRRASRTGARLLWVERETSRSAPRGFSWTRLFQRRRKWRWMSSLRAFRCVVYQFALTLLTREVETGALQRPSLRGVASDHSFCPFSSLLLLLSFVLFVLSRL